MPPVKINKKSIFSAITGNHISSAVNIIIVMGAILFYLGVIWFYTSNIAESDSYLDQMFVLVDYETQEGWRGKIDALIRQYIYHNHLLSRLFSFVPYVFFGKVDYHILNLISIIPQIGILYIFYKKIQERELPIYAITVISLIIFNFYAWDVVVWGMCGPGYIGTAWFSFLCFYFLDKKSPRIILALICAFIATYTMANGLLSVFIGTAIVLFKKYYSESGYRARNVILWIAGCGVLLLPYLLSRDIFSSSSDNIVSPDIEVAAIFLRLPFAFFDFIASLGGFFFHPSANYYLKTFVGIIFLGFIGFVSFKNVKDIKNICLPVFGFMLFSMASLYSVSLFRYDEVPSMVSFKLLSSFVYSCAIFLFFEKKRENKTIHQILILLLVIFLYAKGFFLHQEDFQRHKNDNEVAMLKWFYGDNKSGLIGMDGIIKEAARYGIYDPFDNDSLPIAKFSGVTSRCSFDVGKVEFISLDFHESQESMGVFMSSSHESARNDSYNVFFCKSPETGLLYRYKTNAGQRLSFLVDKRTILPGEYEIYIVSADGSRQWKASQVYSMAAAFDYSYGEYCKNMGIFGMFKSFSPVVHYFCHDV